MPQNPDGSADRTGPDRSAPDASPDGDAKRGAKRNVANRRFDTVKVARLKDDIEAGRYEIDPFSIADRFIEHERNGP